MMRFLTVSLLVAACGTPAEPPTEHSPTQIDHVRTAKEAPPPIEFTAVVTSKVSRVIASQVQARVDKLNIHAGQIIKAGDMVASLDKTELQTELAAAQEQEKSSRAEAGAYGAQAGALSAKVAAERNLVKLGVSAPISLTVAMGEAGQNGGQAAAASARAGAARATREQKEKDLANADIAAPISGVVTNIKTHEGEIVQKGVPLARVFDPSDLIVRFAVPREHAGKVRLGARVELVVEGNPRSVWATVTNISGAQEPPINFSVVEADIDDSKLAPGELSVASVGRVRIADQIADARGAKR
jgi:multidrug efflux pump subunit AcrA (membrane-fusion protein)